MNTVSSLGIGPVLSLYILLSVTDCVAVSVLGPRVRFKKKYKPVAILAQDGREGPP